MQPSCTTHVGMGEGGTALKKNKTKQKKKKDTPIWLLLGVWVINTRSVHVKPWLTESSGFYSTYEIIFNLKLIYFKTCLVIQEDYQACILSH